MILVPLATLVTGIQSDNTAVTSMCQKQNVYATEKKLKTLFLYLIFPSRFSIEKSQLFLLVLLIITNILLFNIIID